MNEKANSFQRITKEDREKTEALSIAKQTVSEIKQLQTAFNEADIHSKEYLESLGDTIANALENLHPLLENQPDVIVDTQSIESVIVKAFTRFDTLVNEIKNACENIKVPDVHNTVEQPDIKIDNSIELDKLEDLLRQELPQIFNQLIEAIPVVEPINWEPVSDRLDTVIELLEKLVEKKWINTVVGGGGGASNIPMVQGPGGRWVVPVGNEDGSPISGGGGGGSGDASAAKQDEQTAVLQEIRDNTASIEVSVGDVDVNTDQLEAKVDVTNTKLDTIASQQQQDALTDSELRAAPVVVDTGLTPQTDALTDTELRAAPVVVDDGHPDPQTDSLTDAELRAAPVPVDTGLTIPTPQTDALTDDELRAAPVVVDDGHVDPQTDALTNTELRAAPVQTVDNNKQDVMFYAQVLTSSTTLSPSAGKALKIVKVQVLQNPDNETSNRVTLGFTSTGDFFTGWVVSDSSEVIGDVDEDLTITLASSAPISVIMRYKEI